MISLLKNSEEDGEGNVFFKIFRELHAVFYRLLNTINGIKHAPITFL